MPNSSTVLIVDADDKPPDGSNQSSVPVVSQVVTKGKTGVFASAKKSGREGCEKGAVAYSTTENLSLLWIPNPVMSGEQSACPHGGKLLQPCRIAAQAVNHPSISFCGDVWKD